MAGPSWSYNQDALDVPLFQVRFLIGDVDPDGTQDWLFSDQEITALLPGGFLATGSITTAAVALCKRLVARYSRLVDVSEGGASAQMSQLRDHYKRLAAEISSAGGVSAASLVASSVFSSDYAPAFTRQLGDPRYP